MDHNNLWDEDQQNYTDSKMLEFTNRNGLNEFVTKNVFPAKRLTKPISLQNFAAKQALKFSAKDDEKLLKLFDVYPFDWKRISSHFRKFDSNVLYYRYLQMSFKEAKMGQDETNDEEKTSEISIQKNSFLELILSNSTIQKIDSTLPNTREETNELERAPKYEFRA